MINFSYGQIISYGEMCFKEGRSLQNGMHFHVKRGYSIFLMNKAANAPYEDREECDGKILIYEGHDAGKSPNLPNPKVVDQPEYFIRSLTANGKFYQAAQKCKQNQITEMVKVYEKIKPGIWVFNGYFKLLDAWKEQRNGRMVFKFKLEIEPENDLRCEQEQVSLNFSRMIPSAVKREVYARDKGQCVVCGSRENLHFDHILPFSKGGTSLKAENIQLLCAKHNLEKSNTFKY